MEAIIRTTDRNLFQTVLHYLKSLHITVEIKGAVSGSILEKRKKTGDLSELILPTYKCGGKKSDFNREDLYDSRL